MNYRRRSRSNLIKTLTATGALTLGVVGMTVVSAGASPPAADEIENARQVAERAAATESAVRTLRLEVAEERAAREGAFRAEALFAAAQSFQPLTFPALPEDWVAAGMDLTKAVRDEETGKLVQVLPDGSRIIFTIDADVQERLNGMLRETLAPHGSVVLIDPPTGRVIAMTARSQPNAPYDYPNFERNASPPSASVFKVVTAAALMEGAGISPHKEVCYHGGVRSLTERNITGDPRYDNECNDLEAALARSLNSLIAKQSYYHLSKEDLTEWAERFGYNQEIPFELPVQISTATFEDDPFERARAAAGFWHTHLSPLHGALIGAALANDGVMMQPTLLERYEAPNGDVIYEFEPKVWREVMQPETAQKLSEMMFTTTRTGSARRYFGQRRAFPRQVAVSGKTGTLSNQNPFLRFTWFVGFARHEAWEDHPGVAVAGLMANGESWHMLGPFAASEGVRHYFSVEGQRRSAAASQIAAR